MINNHSTTNQDKLQVLSSCPCLYKTYQNLPKEVCTVQRFNNQVQTEQTHTDRKRTSNTSCKISDDLIGRVSISTVQSRPKPAGSGETEAVRSHLQIQKDTGLDRSTETSSRWRSGVTDVWFHLEINEH